MKVTISGCIYDIDNEGKMLGKVDVVVEGDTLSENPGKVAETYNKIMDIVTKEGD